MGKRFIEIRNKSAYSPSTEHPRGEIQEDTGFFSFENGREMFVLRQFHSGGFVNRFKLDSIAPDKKTIVFITESIENIPKGWRAKETYRLLNDKEIEETFELAEPGKDFAVYTRVKLVGEK